MICCDVSWVVSSAIPPAALVGSIAHFLPNAQGEGVVGRSRNLRFAFLAAYPFLVSQVDVGGHAYQTAIHCIRCLVVRAKLSIFLPCIPVY